MGVDFVKPDDKTGPDGKPAGYDVEYTNPATDETSAPLQKKPRASLLNWLSRSKSAAKSKPLAPAQPVTLPATPKIQTQPDKAYAVTEHQEATLVPQKAALPNVARPASAVGKTVPQAGSVPAEQLHVARVLPPPPPPPTQLRTKPKPATQVNAVAAPSIAVKPAIPTAPAAPIAPIPPTIPKASAVPNAPTTPVQPPVTTASAPVVKSSMATAPRAGRGSAPTASANDSDAAGSVVIARNVSGMHGDTTNPEALPDTGLNVNLLPDYAIVSMRGLSAVLRLLRFGVLCVCFFTLLYGALVGYQAYYIFQTEVDQKRLQNLNDEILGYANLQQQVVNTNTTLAALNDLLQRHVYWTNWFAFLEQHTLSNVYFTDFSGSQDGVMNLEGVAPNFATVTHQINAFRAAGDAVQAIDVSTASSTAVTTAENSEAAATGAATSLVHFTISLHVDPAILLNTSDYQSYE